MEVKNTDHASKTLKEREIILIGILNVEDTYGKDWLSKRNEIKKELELEIVKLNRVFREPALFHEKFEVLSAEDYALVKKCYIYSSILIFNPNLMKQKKDHINSSTTLQPNQSTIGSTLQEEDEKQTKIKKGTTMPNKELLLSSESPQQTNCALNTNKEITKKKEGIGVLILTCKKMPKARTKYMVIEMIKKQIKVKTTLLKCKDSFQNIGHINNKNKNNSNNSSNNNNSNSNSSNVKNKDTELKSLEEQKEDEEEIPINMNNFHAKRNNFFNMTAYLYGSSTVLSNTSLIHREYCEEEWINKLRRKKKEEANAEMQKESNKGFIKSFTSYFKSQ